MASSTTMTTTTTTNHSTTSSTDETSGRHHHDWYHATISSLTQLTPTVTGITLMVNVDTPTSSCPQNKEKEEQTQTSDNSSSNTPFIFQPGQWVDFYIPSLNEVGGYSITSLPSHLPQLELAVKSSNHPPALWVTTRSKVGDHVKLRVGGTFTYNQNNKDDNKLQSTLLFVAGGVGINPLYGMLRQLHENEKKKSSTMKVVVLYSSSTCKELLFETQLTSMQKDFPSIFKMIYFVTQENKETKNSNNHNDDNNNSDNNSSDKSNPSHMSHNDNNNNPRIKYGCRITSKDIGDAIVWAGENENVSSVYICGPPGMAEEMTNICVKDHGISRSNIYFEQWW